CSWSIRVQQKLRRNQGRLSEAAREILAALEKAIDGGYALTWKLRCAMHVVCGRIVARLDRKCLGQEIVRESSPARGIFDKQARRKPLAIAVDAVLWGLNRLSPCKRQDLR